jgi:hypothetical protein
MATTFARWRASLIARTHLDSLLARPRARVDRAAGDRPLHFVVWGAQMLLASFFAITASLKLLLHYDRLIEVMAWAAVLPAPAVRALGACELLAAIVVAAPVVTPAPQRVVGWTAVGFVSLMALATAIHVAQGELRMVPVSLAIAALATFVAWGRLAHESLENQPERPHR